MPEDRARLRRDLTALVLMVLGGLGLIACAFATSPLAGAAALSVGALVVGIALGAAS